MSQPLTIRKVHFKLNNPNIGQNLNQNSWGLTVNNVENKNPIIIPNEETVDDNEIEYSLDEDSSEISNSNQSPTEH